MIPRIIKKEIGQYAFQYEINTQNGDRAGFMRVDTFPHMSHFNWALISNLHVIKKYRRYGLGTSLIKRAINDFCTKGRGLYLLVTQDNDQALSLYFNLGFEKVREYQFKNDDRKYFVLAYGNGPKDQLRKVDFSN